MAAKAVIQTLKHVWRTLDTLQVPMALCGGLSLAFWRHPRLTHDVDLMLSLGAIDERRLVEILAKADFRPKHPPVNLEDVRLVQVIYEPPDTFMDVQVDLLCGETEHQKQALSRRVQVYLPDVDFDVAVLTCEDLIIQKLAAGRLIDKSDAAMLLRFNRESLDFGYLFVWRDRLKLVSEWNDIWNETFPGESSPLG